MTAEAAAEGLWEEVLSMIRGTHPRCGGEPQYLVGVEEGYGLRYVPVRDMGHVLVAGATGSGKSVFLLSQILQDVLRGSSVFVFDPHGDLAWRLLTHIPRDRWEDVVYVNPLTAKEHGRVVRYNFLEVREGEEPTFVKRSFMDALQKNYPDFWGPRLDAILSHAIDLLLESSEAPTLPKLGRLLSRESYRNILLSNCRSEDVRDFWHLTFPNYRDDAITAAQNKLYKILEEVLIEPITSAEHSTIDFWNLMEGGKVVIFDLREGALTPEIVSFVGTLFLARIYQAGMARERLPEGERRYCRVYVDEASRFMTDVLRENMQALRKYNVFLTVVCQNLDQFLGKGGNLSQYANTVAAFQCSRQTAEALEGFFPLLPADRAGRRFQHLERARLYHFYLSVVVGTRRRNYYLRSVDPGIGESRPEEVVARSLERWGEAYDFREKRAEIELPRPDMGPAAYSALSELEQRGEMSEESIQEKLHRFEKRAVTDALFSLKERGLASSEWRKGVKGNQRFWRITGEGVEYLYPTGYSGNRLGGAKHIAMLCLACWLYREMGFYPVIISGERRCDTVRILEGERKVDLYPDLILYPQYRVSSTRSNPTSWDTSRPIAVEIEAFPAGGRYTGAHLDRTKAHFVKARDVLKMPVIFVVHTEREAEAVRRALREEGAVLVPDVLQHYAPGCASVRVLGAEYERAIGAGAYAGTRLALQVRKLAEVARQADISDLAEPEDFYEEGKVPPHASRRWVEEMRRREKLAEERAMAGVREGRPAVEIEPIGEKPAPEEVPPAAPEAPREGGEGPGAREAAGSPTQESPAGGSPAKPAPEPKEEISEQEAGRGEGAEESRGAAGAPEEKAGKPPVAPAPMPKGKPPEPKRAGSGEGSEEGRRAAGKPKEGEGEPERGAGVLKPPTGPTSAPAGKELPPAPGVEPETPRAVGEPGKEPPLGNVQPSEQVERPGAPPGRPEEKPAGQPATPRPRKAERSEPGGDFDSWAAGLKSMGIEAQIRELAQRGARWRVKEASGKKYCCARIWFNGKRKEVCLGPLDGLREALKKEGIWLE